MKYEYLGLINILPRLQMCSCYKLINSIKFLNSCYGMGKHNFYTDLVQNI